MIELLSIDLSNYCSKQCDFCYNHSTRKGNTLWKPQEVIDFAADCVKHGVKSVSLGGGEPFEYNGIFDVIDTLFPLCYLSVTSNGLPLEQADVWNKLCNHKPDKIHITIHQPNNEGEVERVKTQIGKIASIGITPGVNILVGADKIDAVKSVWRQLRQIVEPKQIILVPQRFSNTPTPQQLGSIVNGEPFQSPSCLLNCQKPENFCSISWDKKANFCSYAPCKQPLTTLDYNGLQTALKNVKWKSCHK